MSQIFDIKGVGRPRSSVDGKTLTFTLTSMDGFAMDLSIAFERFGPMLLELYALQARGIAAMTGHDLPNAMIPIAVKSGEVRTNMRDRQCHLSLKDVNGLEFMAVLGPRLTSEMAAVLTEASARLKHD